jgi:sucrose phosphorylase
MPGIPQIYYVGLLAGENDMALLATTGVGRDINRHYFSTDEVRSALQQPLVQDLLDLIRLRNSSAAFAGQCELLESDAQTLNLRWVNESAFAALSVNFVDLSYRIDVGDGEAVQLHKFRCH